MQIGPHSLPNRLFVAPMAGVTDRPFRQLCRGFGAGYAVSEMVTSRKDLWHTLKTSRRADHTGEPGPIAVQIAGTDAAMMAEAAAYNIARAAESAGVQMVTVHGRTREQGYKGAAEYATIAAVKAALRIPVVANGDIDSPHKAQAVLRATGADALMIGRAAQGRPWIFREIAHYLNTGALLAPPLVLEVRRALLAHLQDHYGLYGEFTGVRSARKHIGWYVRDLPGGDAFRARMNGIDSAPLQWQLVADYFEELADGHERLPTALADQPTGALEAR